MTKTFFSWNFSSKSQKNFFEFFFSIFVFVLTDHFNSKYMFYDSFGLNSRKKKFHFIKKNFPQKFEGGHFDNAQNCRFFAMEVIFWPEMAKSAELFFSGHLRPPIITTIFFFEIDWIVVEECLFKVWKSKNRKKWFAPWEILVPVWDNFFQGW